MKTLALAALLCLSACGPELLPRYITRCGTMYMGSYPVDGAAAGEHVPGWTHTAIQQIEDVTVETLARVVQHDPRFSQNDICRHLNGVQIYVHPNTSFARPSYRPDLQPPGPLTKKESQDLVAGISDCLYGIMVLANVEGSPKWSAYSHEMVHFVQSCSSRPEPGVTFQDEDAAQHSNWANDGIYSALNEIPYR